jgi:uncharacterized protein YbjQ (UPF0145 family)
MKLSTATTFDESKYEVIGIVMGMQSRSLSMLREFLSSFGTVFGGKSTLFNTKMLKAREDAIDEMKKNAEAMGADMVVAIDVDAGNSDIGGSPIFTFVATGTALRLKRGEPAPVGGKRHRKTLRRKAK